MIETQHHICSFMAALAVCPNGAVAEVYSCEIKEWVRVDDEGLVRPALSAALAPSLGGYRLVLLSACKGGMSN